MTKKLRVGVIFGGRSGEHEVSLRSAESVINAMDRAKYEIIPIGITKEGRWLVSGDAKAMLPQTVMASTDQQQLTRRMSWNNLNSKSLLIARLKASTSVLSHKYLDKIRGAFSPPLRCSS